ncbi:hypothetical protein BOSEA31B_14843 [Hyphomicrobiales bacterium]|nr:hypothetical protein BOSEA31B_14843 [Hyphomicrobiales bacterium]
MASRFPSQKKTPRIAAGSHHPRRDCRALSGAGANHAALADIGAGFRVVALEAARAIGHRVDIFDAIAIGRRGRSRIVGRRGRERAGCQRPADHASRDARAHGWAAAIAVIARPVIAIAAPLDGLDQPGIGLRRGDGGSGGGHRCRRDRGDKGDATGKGGGDGKRPDHDETPLLSYASGTPHVPPIGAECSDLPTRREDWWTIPAQMGRHVLVSLGCESLNWWVAPTRFPRHLAAYPIKIPSCIRRIRTRPWPIPAARPPDPTCPPP